MLVKLVTLRFDPRLGGFDDRPLQELLRGHEALAVSDHFFVHDEVPHWAFMLTCRMPEAEGEPAAARAPGDGAGRTSYREILRQQDWPLFNSLRDWRAAAATKEGVPPYIIVPNDVLAWIARERPRTLGALAQIRGMGAARLKRHGRALLAALGAPAKTGGTANAGPEESSTPGGGLAGPGEAVAGAESDPSFTGAVPEPEATAAPEAAGEEADDAAP